MKIGICIILIIILILLAILYIVLQDNVDEILYKQARCKHDFKYKQNVWRYAGDILMHQYECAKCGRKDYLIARDDPDKDWNHGCGDGKLGNIEGE